jgi:hypothetical protein
MSKKQYDGDSILHRLFSLLFWITVCGGVCLLIGVTLMLGFATGPKPTNFNEFMGLLVLSTCAFPVLLLAVYRSLLYIIYGGNVAYKFKNHWQASFVPTLLLIVLLIIGYFAMIFGDSKGAQITRLKQVQSVTPIIEQRKEQSISQKRKKASTVSKPSISIWDAALDGNNEAIKQHLAAGTDVNVQKTGEAALSYASWSGQAETVELLIRSGADVNTRNNGNSTPLFHAAGDRHTDVVKLLIVNGAEVNAINDKGETPLDSAESAKAWGPGKKETIALLRKHGGKTGSELKPSYSIFEAAKKNQIDTVKQQLGSGVNVNSKDNDGFTALHWAVYRSHTLMTTEWQKFGRDSELKSTKPNFNAETTLKNGNRLRKQQVVGSIPILSTL